MRPFDVVATDPVVEIDLQLCDRAIDLFPERDAVELVEDRLVKALDNSIRLWALGFGPGMIDVFDGQVEFVFVVLGVAAIFRAPVGQNAAEFDLLLLEEGHDAIVDEIGGGDRGLAIVELGERDLRIGVEEGLLVDPGRRNSPDIGSRTRREPLSRSWPFPARRADFR